MHKRNHWTAIQEQGCFLGLKIMLFAYQFFGRCIVSICLYPVMTYYYLIAVKARKASKAYQAILMNYRGDKINCFKHFLTFGQALIDKMAVWNDEIAMDDIEFPNKSMLIDDIRQAQGGIILTAHLGNMEVARALSRFIPGLTVNALVYDKHAGQFNQILNKVNPDFKLNMINVEVVDVSLAIQLEEKVAQGEFIVIAADRVSVTQPQRAIGVDVLGVNANLPEGVFVLASLLKTKVYFMACMKKENSQFDIALKKLVDGGKVSKTQRQQYIRDLAIHYASELTRLCCDYPYQWFNFYQFWQNRCE